MLASYNGSNGELPSVLQTGKIKQNAQPLMKISELAVFYVFPLRPVDVETPIMLPPDSEIK